MLNVYGQRNGGEQIRLNQEGYYPEGPKLAVVTGEHGDEFYLVAADGKKVWEGKLTTARASTYNPKKTSIADFSAFQKPGTYRLVVKGVGESYPFNIRKHVHEAVAKGSIKAFYYIRASTPLTPTYAGKWSRAEGHPDNKVLVHSSAATAQRPAGTIISSPRGWYDAGDYNKYIVNSGITTGTLLSLYEDFPAAMNTATWNIPESGNTTPDLLDEVLWNVRWMLTMQDPNDGGVYHKCTNASFDKMEMPDKAVALRYAVQKSTAAALDFAAVMAQAARVYKEFPKQWPGLSDSCLTAAKQAWTWAQKNPAQLYEQNAINASFEPKISTGAYGDRDVKDEFIWAAIELFLTTGETSYYNTAAILPDDKMPLPSWAQVRLLGYYSLLRLSNTLTGAAKTDAEKIKSALLKTADALLVGVNERAYPSVMGQSAKDFIWGSSAVAANEGILLLQAYAVTKDKKYVDNALSNLDYLLGRNATGYSFMTGFGSKTPMHPHHRPSEADGIAEPIPGMLAGGPNPSMQDKCNYASAIPDEAYVDDVCSFASNEIAINWNAPFVYLAFAVEALENTVGYSH
ncbi:glycoside hydrolase family 9 protein [Chryseolinea sp. Jin1]|uniref:Endoglucanase n=2 Tax=Chryseolinea lacunae TaxID=2801331 RepID=A0ABS1KTQ2_9BACT|nr:glycoside hydrolase family 9 protein [Chryseolinea lacunae]MBL0742825.1 glycoside hydrolase family 9 protein [Chryseolinea lacunae]